MKYKIIKKDQAITSDWSGGTTSQLYIYPEYSEYKKRNFMYRISTAVAYDEVSTYTSLSGVDRHLISLESNATISHKDHFDFALEPYGKTDVFDGGWETTAYGKIKDFNLMTANGASGKMQVADEKICLGGYDHYAVYCGEGGVEINGFELKKGDLIVIYDVEKDDKLNVYTSNDAKIIVCFIKLQN